MESLLSKDVAKYNKKIIFNAGVEASIDYGNPKNTYTPDVQLLFSPFGLPFVPIEIIGTNVNKIISELTWTKDRNNPGGIFSCTLAPDAKTIQDIVNIINKFSFNLYSRIWGELGVDLEDLFKTMTLCQVWIDGYHVATGTVRSCIRNSGVSNTSKDVSYSLIVDELGNMYNMDTVTLDTMLADGIQFQAADALKSALELVSMIKAIPLGPAIQLIIEAFKLTTLAQGISLSDGFPLLLRLLATNNPIGAIANLSFANNMVVDSNLYELHSQGGGQQSIWSFLKGLIPSPWMEFFTESGGRTIVTEPLGVPGVMFPGFNYVVARSVPYSNPMLGVVNPAYLAQTLPFDLNVLQMLIGGDFVIITDEMIQHKSLGFDCINQNTVFHTRYTNKGAVEAPDTTDKGIKTVGPLNPYASGGIPTFGIREMFANIECTSLVGLGTASSYAERIAKNTVGLPLTLMSKNALSNLLCTWFRNQARFREGTVTTSGIPYARPGMYCLYLPSISGKKVENIRDIGLYYIDSLTHSYSLDNEKVDFTTTLNLIRGVPLPLSIAQTALLLFDFEILPPMSGLGDGEYAALRAVRQGLKLV